MKRGNYKGTTIQEADGREFFAANEIGVFWTRHCHTFLTSVNWKECKQFSFVHRLPSCISYEGQGQSKPDTKVKGSGGHVPDYNYHLRTMSKKLPSLIFKINN